MNEKLIFLIILVICTVILDFIIYYNLKSKSADTISNLLIKQTISYIIIAVSTYNNYKEQSSILAGDRKMGMGFAMIGIIIGMPIFILIIDGISNFISYLTNTTFLYWILYLINIFIDLPLLLTLIDDINKTNKINTI